MISKINVTGIVKDHLDTLCDFGTQRISPFDIILFFVVPAFVAVPVALFTVPLTSNIASLLITILSIFAALLFNLLLILFDIMRKSETIRGQAQIQNDFLQEIYNNVSYCILLSIVIVLLVIVALIDINIPVINRIITGTVVYLTSSFTLTLLMVLKRIHALLAVEFRNGSVDKR
jgi:hypothetical protein